MFISPINSVCSCKYRNVNPSFRATNINNLTNQKNNIKKVIILLGAPNSGKGTYAREISAKYSIPQISTGDILRQEVKNGTALGKKAQTYMNSGALVPDELIIGMFKNRIAQKDCLNGFILDGFPRTVAQAKKLDELLKSNKNIETKVINLDVAEQILYQRSANRYMCTDCSKTHSVKNYNPLTSKCECGGKLIKRSDDTPEILKQRLIAYNTQSSPLINYYKEQLRNIHVSESTQSANEILNKVFDCIAK